VSNGTYALANWNEDSQSLTFSVDSDDGAFAYIGTYCVYSPTLLCKSGLFSMWNGPNNQALFYSFVPPPKKP